MHFLSLHHCRVSWSNFGFQAELYPSAGCTDISLNRRGQPVEQTRQERANIICPANIITLAKSTATMTLWAVQSNLQTQLLNNDGHFWCFLISKNHYNCLCHRLDCVYHHKKNRKRLEQTKKIRMLTYYINTVIPHFRS